MILNALMMMILMMPQLHPELGGQVQARPCLAPSHKLFAVHPPTPNVQLEFHVKSAKSQLKSRLNYPSDSLDVATEGHV